MSPSCLEVLADLTCQSSASTRTVPFLLTRGVQSSVAFLPQEFLFSGFELDAEVLAFDVSFAVLLVSTLAQPLAATAVIRRATPPTCRHASRLVHARGTPVSATRPDRL